MRPGSFAAHMGIALAFAFGAPDFSFAEEPDSAVVEAPPPPAKRARLSAPT